jgi:hypothetical protein
MDSLKLAIDQIQANPALAGFCAMLGLLVVSWVWPRRAPRSQTTTALDEPHVALLQLQADLQSLAHDLNSQLDSRMHELRVLLQEARTTIEQLRDKHNVAKLDPTAGPPKPAPDPIPSRSLGAGPPASAADDSSNATRPPARPPAGSNPDSAPLRAQRYEHVYSLADAGLDSDQIAAETGMLRGEVDLVLNLRRKKYRISSPVPRDAKQLANTIEAASV